MKKMINIAAIYIVFAMVGGVFSREFTKFYDYTGITTLKVLHTHLLVLGTFLFLFLALAYKMMDLQKTKQFGRFLLLYNIALPFMTVMLLVRGIVQVLGINLGSGDAAISGIAGISHILIAVSLILLFLALKEAASRIP